MKIIIFQVLFYFPLLVIGQTNFPSPQNLQLQHWYNMGNYLQLNWDTPDTNQTNAQLVGYKVFRNLEICDSIPNYLTSYVEFEPPFLNDTIFYHLIACYINPIGESASTDTVYHVGQAVRIEGNEGKKPLYLKLIKNYPNPFNANTTIEFHISSQNIIEIAIFDILGNKIKTLIHEERKPGIFKINFNGSNLPSGLYYYQLRFKDFSITKKMLLLK